MKYIFLLIVLSFLQIACLQNNEVNIINSNYRFVLEADSARVVEEANKYLTIDPVPITSSSCERSLGTINDFYSEGDYWWPNPENPDSPYVRRDGLTNPDNFKDHRIAMRNMSIYVASLTAAYKITKQKQYAEQAVRNLRTWFVEEKTRMNPNMNYAQAIKGICPGRGVGLIDGIHLVEPARAVSVLHKMEGIDAHSYNKIVIWFEEFINWMTTHEYGVDERERKNNHGSAWVMQLAEYARLTNNEIQLEYCRDRFKNTLLPNQMAEDGSFPMELKRTKPYGYSLFNIDILSTVCKILSTPANNLWEYKLSGEFGMEEGLEFIYPFIKDKTKWKLPPDVMYWEEWPVRHPSLLFGGMAFKNDEYLQLWKSLDPLPETEEGLRNFPIRQPILWIE